MSAVTHAELNEKALRARGGDKEAESEIFVLLDGLVWCLSRKIKIEGADADDLFQEGLIALTGAIAGYDAEKGNFYAYCHRCITNRLLSSVRSSKRDKHSFLNRYVSIYSEAADLLVSPAPLPEDELIMREDFEALNKRIDLALTPLEKKVLAEYLESKSYREIAIALGIGQKAVDNALKRVKIKLKKEGD